MKQRRDAPPGVPFAVEGMVFFVISPKKKNKIPSNMND